MPYRLAATVEPLARIHAREAASAMEAICAQACVRAALEGALVGQGTSPALAHATVRQWEALGLLVPAALRAPGHMTAGALRLEPYEAVYGVPGIMGLPGIMGYPGAIGFPGALAFPGAMGIPGIMAFPGMIGFPGIMGIPGAIGLPGMTGVPGLWGYPGLGPAEVPGMLGWDRMLRGEPGWERMLGIIPTPVGIDP